jgi:hypothetical protein
LRIERFSKGQKVEGGEVFPSFRKRLLHSALWPAQDDLSLLERYNPAEARKLTQKRLFRNSGKGFRVQLGGRPHSKLNSRRESTPRQVTRQALFLLGWIERYRLVDMHPHTTPTESADAPRPPRRHGFIRHLSPLQSCSVPHTTFSPVGLPPQAVSPCAR